MFTFSKGHQLLTNSNSSDIDLIPDLQRAQSDHITTSTEIQRKRLLIMATDPVNKARQKSKTIPEVELNR